MATSMLTFADTLRYAIPVQCRFATSQRCMRSSITPKPTNFSRKPSKDSSSGFNSREREKVSKEKFPGQLKDERPKSHAAGDSRRTNVGRSQSVGYKSFGTQKRDKKGFLYDMKEQQAETGIIQDAAFLNAVVKVYCTHTAPDYSLPWQKQRQFTSTGRHVMVSLKGKKITFSIIYDICIRSAGGLPSAFMIGDGKLLTNAHCVEHHTQVKVKRRGDDTKYVAKVLARGVECDIALLSVESQEFWKGAESLRFGRLPSLQDAVTVVGYPLGGDTISVTKGVVSRIEVLGNSGGPAFNDQGECIGVAFQVFRSEEAENIGYVIPTTVVSHFLNDYERNGKYTGFPCLGVLLQKLENPALRACLKVHSNEGVLVRRVEPTSDANNVLKQGDVIVSFDGVRVGCEGTVPFRSNERIAFRYLISQKSFSVTSALLCIMKLSESVIMWGNGSYRSHCLSEECNDSRDRNSRYFSVVILPAKSRMKVVCLSLIMLDYRFAGDVAELGIIRAGNFMKVNVVLDPRVHLVPYHIEGGQPSYLIIAGLVFTPLSEPLIDEECEDSIGLKLLAKARYSLARFKGEQIVILSQVLANEVNIGYEDMGNQQASYFPCLTVLKLNGIRIRNIHHLAHLVDSCKDKYLLFEFEDNFLVVLEREAAIAASSCVLRDYGIPSERSSDLLEPYVVSLQENKAMDQDLGDSPVSNLEIAFDGLLWA
ncbi:Protease Do-like, PDZ domain [Dillenia turbinata]|uniref:Protease Do-like, PDZ domain n=1 Tax=Dillenia turbinata TaxID=194707 RepID=A0AAN8W6L6_9MAGN